jgi:hypothetical protein
VQLKKGHEGSLLGCHRPQFAASLKSLGVVEIADLVDLTDADYIELGMSAGEGAKAANRSASTW